MIDVCRELALGIVRKLWWATIGVVATPNVFRSFLLLWFKKSGELLADYVSNA